MYASLNCCLSCLLSYSSCRLTAEHRTICGMLWRNGECESVIHWLTVLVFPIFFLHEQQQVLVKICVQRAMRVVDFRAGMESQITPQSVEASEGATFSYSVTEVVFQVFVCCIPQTPTDHTHKKMLRTESTLHVQPNCFRKLGEKIRESVIVIVYNWRFVQDCYRIKGKVEAGTADARGYVTAVYFCSMLLR